MKNKMISNLTGLRGIAALLVFLYHINSNIFSGAFLAVDFFFLLSGFLTVYQFNREYAQSGEIKIGKYYKKRIVKIFPSLLLMIFSVFAIFSIIAPYQLADLKDEVIAAIFGVINYHYIFNNVDYFAASLIIDPFSHLWAIAIELQFYVIAPLIYLLAMRKSKIDGQIDFSQKRNKSFIYIMYFTTATFMPILYLITQGNISVAYFGTLSRLSCLMLGMLIAYNYSNESMQREYQEAKPFYNIFSIVITLAFVISIFTLSGTSEFLYHFGFIIIDIILGFYMWMLCCNLNVLTPFFSSKLLTYFGKRSYGIYLWHMPLIAIFQLNHSFVNTLFIFILTLISSEITYQFIDMGIIAKRKRRFNELFKTIGLALMLFLCVEIGYFLNIDVNASSITQEQYVKTAKELNSLTTELDNFNHLYQNPAIIIQNVESDFKTYIEIIPQIEASTNILVGDSIMRQIILSLNSDFTDNPSNFTDAEIGLQLDGLTEKMLKYQYLDGEDTNLIFNVGNNGPVTRYELKQLVELYPESNIYLLELISNQEWTSDSSNAIAKVAKHHDNVHLVPVRKLLKEDENLLLEDNLHYTDSTVSKVKVLILKTMISVEQ